MNLVANRLTCDHLIGPHLIFWGRIWTDIGWRRHRLWAGVGWRRYGLWAGVGWRRYGLWAGVGWRRKGVILRG